MRDQIEYQSGPTISQRAPIYVDVTKDPRARSSAYLNLYASRIGAPVIAVDEINGNLFGASSIFSSLGSSGSLGSETGDNTDYKKKNPKDPTVKLDFSTPENVAATWDSKGNLTVTWDFDTTNGDNQYVTEFDISFITSYKTKVIQSLEVNTNGISQSYTYYYKDLASVFVFPPTFTSIKVVATDGFGHYSAPGILENPPLYNTNLPAPEITVTSVNQGYTVAWTDVKSTYPTIENISIEEIISSSSTAPLSGYRQVSLGYINPTTIITGGLEKRWVKARYVDGTGSYGPYSQAYAITPTAIVVVNTEPPNEVTSVSGTFSNSAQGDDVIITATLPTEKPGNSFIIKLIPTSASSLSGYFYFFPADTSSPKTFTISKADIYAQFGRYYSSYTGLIISVSSVGNRSNGASISQFNRLSSLTGVTPTFSVSPAANGYIVTWTNISGATYADIYEKATSWGGGNPTDESLRVYAGQSPVTIQSLNYTTRYIKIRFYDDYGNTSNYSAEQTVAPYDPGTLSLISNPVAFQTNGSIYAGTYNPTNPSDPSGSSAHAIFNKTGLYVYDSTGKPSTQIIGDQTTVYDPAKTDGTKITSSVTFLTQNAQIADWLIKSDRIENTLSGSPAGGAGTYTGLSASGSYAFWAGSTTSANSTADAKFSVTNSGQVVARKISIVGDGTGSDLINAAGLFKVTNAGALTATSATITGNITAEGGKFTGNVQLVAPAQSKDGQGASLYAGSLPNSGNRVVINSYGVGAFNSSGASTEIITTPITIGTTGNNNSINTGTTGIAVNLFSSAALLGGWIIGPSTISDSAANFVLNSNTSSVTLGSKTIPAGPIMQMTGVVSNTNYYIKVSPPLASTNITNKMTVLEAGLVGNPNFWVENDGTMHASNAVISGAVTVTGGQLQTDINTINSNINTTNTNVTTAQNTANSKNKTSWGTTPPSNPSIGDIWYHVSSQNYLMKRWDGTNWVLASDFISGNGVTIDSSTRTITQIQASGSLALKSGGSLPVVLDGNGLRLNNGTYDTVFLDASTGNATFRGTVSGGVIQTGVNGSATRRIVMGESQPDRIDFYPKTGDDADTAGYLWISDDAGSATLPGLVLKPPTKSTWASPPKIKITQTSAGGFLTLSAVQTNVYGSLISDTYIQHTGNLSVTFSAHRNISAGTANPSGGNLGDVYIQY